MKKIYVVFFLISIWSTASAIREKPCPRYFTVDNLASFPDYTFYFYYQTYPYDNSFQKGEQVMTKIYPENTYRGGDCEDAVYLMASDSSGKTYRSNIRVGGKYISNDPEIESVLDYYTIQGFKDGNIELIYIKEKTFRKDGSSHEHLGTATGQVISPGYASRVLLFLSPLLFGVLVGVFMNIRNRVQVKMAKRSADR